MSNESKCPGHNRAECVSCCWPAPATSYTAVDMTTAAAQGFRDGAASVVVDLPFLFPNYRQQVVEAIIAAGGRIKE